MPTENLQRYLEDYEGHPGFFLPMAMHAWDFLLTAQTDLGIVGGMLEIGVYKGKSAILSSMYFAREEPCFFLDLYDTPEAQTAVTAIRPQNNFFLKMRSEDALTDPRLKEMRGRLRFVHIDGDHTGYSTRSDLDMAAALLEPKGVICVDDFFSFKYPQLTAAVYAFLFENPMAFKLFFAGANKGYICRSSQFAEYDEYIRRHAPEKLDLTGNNWTLARTSYVHDHGCFTLIGRNKNRDVVGLDRNLDEIVF